MKNHRMDMTTESTVSVTELSRQIESLVIFRNSAVISRFNTCYECKMYIYVLDILKKMSGHVT